MHIDGQAIKILTTSQVSTLCVISNAVTPAFLFSHLHSVKETERYFL